MSLGLVVFEEKLFMRTPTPQSDDMRADIKTCSSRIQTDFTIIFSLLVSTMHCISPGVRNFALQEPCPSEPCPSGTMPFTKIEG